MKFSHEEFIGKKFGRLTILKNIGKIGSHYIFECKCDCGTFKKVRVYDLYNGSVVSCGCYHKETVIATQKINLAGKRFGKLVAIESRKIKNKQYEWKCRCDCGNSHYVTTSSLTRTNNPTLSCGCLKCPNLIGQKFGKLTVTKKIDNNKKVGKKVGFWKVICDCGRETIVRTAKLNNGSTKSCGCLLSRKGKYNPHFTGYEEISGRYFSDIKSGSISRNIKFQITIEEIWNLYVKQNKRCALTGLLIYFKDCKHSNQTASLDRIDSNKDYTVDNVQWVHKDINCMKMDFSQAEFINYCKLIAKTHENK